ncbi:glycoside hydrolase family 66 protein [Dysgonomonas sp. 25]|uniref:glycoside hydrolase family 66 protein n=1 Tax=Dysgonomonas sp. 25 TaxID=2302933 RepID=UPI0013D17D6B|nr:glycoside hydrolase family 66 protein [Dysgonomonas sp. 25]NDV68532.1 cycloisomaltooligosaccharide glucanotransferase [Dysgonomonas sp. 25]
MKKRITYIVAALSLLLFAACDDFYDTKHNPVTYGDSYMSINISTDKAVYSPGETVQFALKETPNTNLTVRYSHLGQVLKEESLSGDAWSWTVPADDYKGYMVDVYGTVEGAEKVYYSIAVDVSSDWKKFPRYGFLSSYGKLSEKQISDNIATLNRYHINGIQFYDWMYDHQRPLAGTADNPLASWSDLIGRMNYKSTVEGYIAAAHGRGMKAMFYNLAFGALKNAASDGVKEEWYLFKDTNHDEKDNHHLDAPFRSSIYLTNPANTEWQEYIAGRHKDVYEVFDFDGYHIDQLGNRGTLYDYNGTVVNLPAAYPSFIAAMKQASPDKRLVMNAVSQYGQAGIAASDVDFLYTEVWDESKTFEQLSQVILDNNAYSSRTKNTVLAAYMNYGRSNSAGYMNAPGVLLANAVIFSFGGSHLELGEHYLANEYFPNSNLQMKGGLRTALVHYYDFLVAYQNLLRDGGAFANNAVQSVDGQLSFSNWPAAQGDVAVVGKQFIGKELIHLINFSDANSMDWRDTNGTQKEPLLVTNAEIKIAVNGTANKVWFASPDVNGGVAQDVQFTQSGNELTFTLPSLKYWDMVVIEY